MTPAKRAPKMGDPNRRWLGMGLEPRHSDVFVLAVEDGVDLQWPIRRVLRRTDQAQVWTIEYERDGFKLPTWVAFDTGRGMWVRSALLWDELSTRGALPDGPTDVLPEPPLDEVWEVA